MGHVSLNRRKIHLKATLLTFVCAAFGLYLIGSVLARLNGDWKEYLVQSVIRDVYGSFVPYEPYLYYALEEDAVSETSVQPGTESLTEEEPQTDGAETEQEETEKSGQEQESDAAQSAEEQTESQTEDIAAVAAELLIEGTVFEAATALYTPEQLLDFSFVSKNFYVVSSVTELNEKILNLSEINRTDLTIEKDASNPQILIFHTHGQEGFADSDENGKTIMDVGDRLTELLEQYGYQVIHLKESFDLRDGVLDRSKAYTYANERLNEVLEEYPTIEVVIDLHRDGVAEDKRLVTEINGVQTAQILLFNGISYTSAQGDIDYLYNPYRSENMAMTYKMYLLGKLYYPDLFRCIYISGYRYCLYHVPRSMLIEAGAQTNTYEEVYNAMEPLAKLLDLELTTP